jgi:hypothetical protein
MRYGEGQVRGEDGAESDVTRQDWVGQESTKGRVQLDNMTQDRIRLEVWVRQYRATRKGSIGAV